MKERGPFNYKFRGWASGLLLRRPSEGAKMSQGLVAITQLV